MNDTPSSGSRLFLGVSVPDKARGVIKKATASYKQYTERITPEDNWHITLIFLGNVENPKQYVSRLQKPISLSFVPTISVTHLGRGFQRDQLWAYTTPTPALIALKQELEKRIKAMRMQYEGGTTHDDFTPHINVARLYEVTRGIGLPDAAVRVTYAPKEVYLYKAHQTEDGITYQVIASIPLST